MIKTSRTTCAFLHFVSSHTFGRLLCAAIVAAAIVASAFAPRAHAAVTAIGDVIPVDRIDTEQSEGLPPAGNEYNDDALPGAQNNWEDNLDIIVGQKLPQGGRLDIDSNSILRYQTLIIGDQGMVGSVMRKGTGRVLITGIEAMYSNIPTIIPSTDPSLPPGFNVVSEDLRPPMVGYDMYVGRFGVGTLDILAGGRAEIEDAVSIGDQPGSFGRLRVDGFASLLVSGGFTANALDTDPHQMMIGRRGRGELFITNQGIVVSEAPTGGLSDDIIGAVIGSDAFDNQAVEPGGNGVVTVDGLGITGGIVGAQWFVGGTLQVGGYDNTLDVGLEDFDGDDVGYTSEAGNGTLYVQNGGLVQLRTPLTADPTPDDIDVWLVIGRFGRVVLSGGTIDIGSGSGVGNQAEGRTFQAQVRNDGVIEGSGRIDTGVFINRHWGEVRVNAGQSLIIDASATFTTTPDPDRPEGPLLNYGVIRAIGTLDSPAQLEFIRAPTAPLNPGQPFINQRIPRPTGQPASEFFGGLIVSQNAHLIFPTGLGDPTATNRSGIENIGRISFTGGENYVVGNVLNTFDPAFPLDGGFITATPDSKITFESDLNCGGGSSFCNFTTAQVTVLDRHSFITAGDFRVTLTPTAQTNLFVTGDVGIAGKISVSMSGFSPGSLSIGDSFDIITFTGEAVGVDLTDPRYPALDLDAAALFTNIAVPNPLGFGLPADAVLGVVYGANTISLQVLSLLGFVGADFDGDNFVDFDDLDIWKMNKGITMGATILQGDANGDGRVDGTDYLIWLSQFNMVPTPFPGAGGGSGGSNVNGFVPEPSSLAMLSMAGMLAMAYRRRRA